MAQLAATNAQLQQQVQDLQKQSQMNMQMMMMAVNNNINNNNNSQCQNNCGGHGGDRRGCGNPQPVMVTPGGMQWQQPWQQQQMPMMPM
eukprot:8312125-Ditylum_brightwellii.AAC.1